MRSDIQRALRRVDTSGWKRILVEFGRLFLEISVPPACEILTMGDVATLSDPAGAIEGALSSPIGCSPIKEIVASKGKPVSDITASVSVSDITRPVPYKGTEGILVPLLKKLESAGVRTSNVTIIVGTGTHRPSTPAEKIEMFGEDVARGYRILDHNCADLGCMTDLGKTRKGTRVYINTAFYSADVKIVTGLIESHFMAGVSGGRKGICPALVDQRTIERFHGPEFLESPFADNLVLQGNPCHEEALDVARTVGVDFTVNVTLDKDMRLTGVFAGHLEEAHSRAFLFMKDYTAVPLRHEYDIVLTHSGYAGRNHYQAAKAGCSAVAAVKKNGAVIIAADNRDPEPIGGPDYRNLLARLKALGVEGYLKLIRSPNWVFTKDQWEPEVWGRVLRKIGEEGLIYCAPQIPKDQYSLIPGQSGFDFLEDNRVSSVRDTAQAMVQNAVLYLISEHQERGIQPSMAFLREGPYVVPTRAPSLSRSAGA